MKELKNITIVFLLAVVLLSSAAPAKPANVLLQEGLYAEEVEGNLDAAIRIYERIIADSSAQRSHIAQAMYRQGMCYLKKRDEQQAKVIFGQLVAKFDDQTQIINKVKPMLEDLSDADPAALMPLETLIYLEFGSPGRQIETILNMLRGTPFENPLAAIGGGREPRPALGGKSPSEIMAALLNPSMMAEFKKIRGCAIGITEIRQNNPPMIAVLYPGKSDALRGLILAGLGMAGTAGEPIEGMQTIIIGGTAGVAHDDNVVIIAQPREQLNWCVKQYKGITNEPTLVSSNKSFAKVNKKARQENALTIWANVDEVFTNLSKLFPDKPPIHIADGFVDFKSIDDVIAFFSIQESEIALETNIAFKDGHHCLAYDMIRTPNLSRTGFEAVPSEAVGLISIALGEAESVQAKAIGKRIENLTGLDIGREIFANIEQITLFALPPDSASNQANTVIPPIATCLGLAVTSHNPQQTRQILTRLLTTANLVASPARRQTGWASQSVSEQPEQGIGKYQIGLVNEQKLYCYMDQMNKTTVLSLNQDVIETSISAAKGNRSVYTAGPLKEVMSKLSPTTSKLVLVNVGGAIQVAESNINLDPNDSENNLHQLFAQLATSCSKTVVQLRTDEKLNNFNVRFGVSELPPVNEVFGPIMQLSQSISKAKAEARAKRRKAEAAATVRKADQAPVIDGKAEDLWTVAKKYKIANVLYSPPSSANDLSADYRAMWDQENLYLFVDVRDDVLKNDSEEFYYDDTVEVFVDADNSKSAEYGENDYQYYFDCDRTSPSIGKGGEPYLGEDVKFALVTTDNGYQLEIKFPWSTLGTKPSPGAKIGLDIHVSDDDDGGERDSKITWRDKEDTAWQNPQVFGTAELADLIAWWKFDESEGTNAADNSGNGNNGTLQGDPVWRPNDGKIGGALEFDGTDDYVDLPIGSVTGSLTNCTFATWVNWSGQGNTWQRIFDFGSDTNVNMFLTPNTMDGPMRFAITITGSGDEDRATAPATLPSGWHHVAVTVDADNSTHSLYLDGEVVAENTAARYTPSNLGNTVNNWLGRSQYPSDPYFNGSLDDFRIYNYALSKNEVKKLYSRDE